MIRSAGVLAPLLVAPVALALAACSPGTTPDAGNAGATAGAGSAVTATPSPPSGAASSATASATARSASAVPATSAASPSRSASAAGARPANTGAATLVLEPDGLGVLTPDTHVTHLPFGTAAGTVRSALSRLVGPLTTTPLPDCGQGARTGSSAGRFSVLFDGDRFVGWTDQGSPGRRLTTMAGVGIGSTLAQVRGALTGVTVEPTSLGVEWNAAAGLSGLATSKAPTGTVSVISAGETCVFR